MEFDAAINEWKSVHCETFGKTGCRRIVPGQYLAADPKGRAILVGRVHNLFYPYSLISNWFSNNLYIKFFFLLCN